MFIYFIHSVERVIFQDERAQVFTTAGLVITVSMVVH